VNPVANDSEAMSGRPDLVHELVRRIDGEVRFDRVSRLLYSTDASIYQIEPVGVVLPRTKEDVIATAEIAGQHGVALLPRGGGSSLAGQAVGRAIILDFSKYMNGVVHISREERRVRVQPGITLDVLNRRLATHGLKFGPDPSSGSRATVGGTLGNNGTGAHSILYGMSATQTLETEVVLADGTAARLGPAEQAEVDRYAAQDGLLGQVYRQVPALLARHEKAIQQDYPRTWRRAGGYNLDLARAGEGGPALNLAKLMAGSEGTLGMMVEATLNLHPLPHATGLVIVEFGSLAAALEAVPAVLETRPSAVELNDDHLLTMCRNVPEYAKKLTFVQGDPAALLIVEYYGEKAAEMGAKSERLIERLVRTRMGIAYTVISDAKGMANVWGVRKAAVGLLMSRPGDYKPIAFIEDVAVPVDQLPSFVDQLQVLVDAHGTRAAFYGHASAGCLHVRPLINQKDAESLGAMDSILRGTADLVVTHGGALSGEHGAGLVRSAFNEQVYGPRLYQAFRELKGIFDPDGRMNPGKIVDSPAPLESELRYGASYRAELSPIIGLSFERQQGLDRAIEMCNGQGACRKLDAGAMCPSFQASQEEMHSTRGRGNVLRAAISGRIPGGLTSKMVKEALDLCLACKSCKAECPSAVDMAKLKYEVLYQTRRQGGGSLRDWLMGHAHLVNQMGAALAPVSNWVMRLGVTKLLQHHVLGIHKNRTMPAWARPTFSTWWRRRGGSRPGRNGQVVLFHETLTDTNNPEIGQAAVKVLEAAGFEVILVEDRKCCGRPLLSKGYLDEARSYAAHNVGLLAPYARQGIPILGCEPSCMTMLQDDYRDLIPCHETEVVAQNTYLITEFLAGLAEEGRLELALDGVARKVLVHSHCHERAVRGTDGTVAALKLVPGAEVRPIDAGCCGMAGSFGLEREHYEFSLAVGEGRLFPAVQAAGPHDEVVLTGTSCRDQVTHATGRQVRHPIELLAEAVRENRSEGGLR
jgi:FAD/FMN-containing dehydrogenase/Fe-S oxidoreductase